MRKSLYSLTLLAFAFGGTTACATKGFVKTEVSQAGARFYDDAILLKDILELAKKNQIPIRSDNVKLQRMAGQLHVTVEWMVPVDFVVFDYTFQFSVEASSFIGRL